MQMITVIIGGSGSGKSEYAENYLLSHSEGITRYYLATMQIYDEEGRRKIERHRKLRQGKGFLTIEQPVSIADALMHMEQGEKAVLLECMSNLVANEMFCGEIPKSADEVVEKVTREMELLQQGVSELVIVSNNVFEDGIAYDTSTMEYIAALGRINEYLARRADRLIEVVVGIPMLCNERKG